MLAGLAEIVVRDAYEPKDALEAEHWASCLLGALNVGRIVDAEIRGAFERVWCVRSRRLDPRRRWRRCGR